MSEEKNGKPDGVSRREFLKGAGLVMGGAAVGSVGLLSACGKTTTTTADNVTITAPPITTTTTISQYVDPIDGTVWPTLDALQAHFATSHPEVDLQNLIILNVNGNPHVFTDLKTTDMLADVLRERLGLTALKLGCDRGSCAACTVIADGKAVLSCTIMAVEAQNMQITTVEALSNGITLGPVQQLFYNNSNFQCGYCTPGFLMAAKALLDQTKKPTLAQVKDALSGHICICANLERTVNTVAQGVA